jgi:plastocyanin
MVTPVFNGCTTAMFMDQSAQAASRAVAFPNGNLTYSPKCILINAGQAVTFNGAFSGHPLKPGAAGVATAGSPNNPIPANTNTGTTLAVTFPTAGDYPYFCSLHDGSGMNGVVRVK